MIFILKIFSIIIISLISLNGTKIETNIKKEYKEYNYKIFKEYKTHNSISLGSFRIQYNPQTLISQNQSLDIQNILPTYYKNIDKELEKIKNKIQNPTEFANFIKNLNNIAIFNYNSFKNLECQEYVKKWKQQYVDDALPDLSTFFSNDQSAFSNDQSAFSNDLSELSKLIKEKKTFLILILKISMNLK